MDVTAVVADELADPTLSHRFAVAVATKKRGSAVLLFRSDSCTPLHVWQLSDTRPTSLCFVPASSEEGGGALQDGGAERGSTPACSATCTHPPPPKCRFPLKQTRRLPNSGTDRSSARLAGTVLCTDATHGLTLLSTEDGGAEAEALATADGAGAAAAAAVAARSKFIAPASARRSATGAKAGGGGPANAATSSSFDSFEPFPSHMLPGLSELLQKFNQSSASSKSKKSKRRRKSGAVEAEALRPLVQEGGGGRVRAHGAVGRGVVDGDGHLGTAVPHERGELA